MSWQGRNVVIPSSAPFLIIQGRATGGLGGCPGARGWEEFASYRQVSEGGIIRQPDPMTLNQCDTLETRLNKCLSRRGKSSSLHLLTY